MAIQGLAVFWSQKGGKHQFHSDAPFWLSAKEAVARHRKLFPDDVVHSVRDMSGRFVSFKEKAQ